MRCVSVLVCLWVVLACSASVSAANEEVAAVEKRLARAEERSEALAAAKALGELGEPGIERLARGAQHESDVVQSVCYEVLREQHSKHPATIRVNIAGLSDFKAGRRPYDCAEFLVEQEAREAIPELTRIMNLEEADVHIRYRCASALARLGENESFPFLYKGLSSDDVTVRFEANEGVRTVCGKDLSDFEDYEPRENLYVFGGGAYRATGDAVYIAKWRVVRAVAILEFSQWLKKEQAGLYGLLPNHGDMWKRNDESPKPDLRSIREKLGMEG